MKTNWMLMLLAPMLAVGCADATVPDDEAGDAKDASFLVDGRADAWGVSEGSADALAVLNLVNTASLSTLDDDAALDARAADNIVAYRIGDDGRVGTADDETFDTLVELDRIPYVGPAAFSALLDYTRSNGGTTIPGDAEVNGFTEGTREAEAILAAANLLDAETLDDEAGLDARAARNITEYRAGFDGRAGTSDDRTFTTLGELDRISYVGPSAFTSLLEYALANDLVARDDGTRPGESSDPFSSTYCKGVPMTQAEAVGHFNEGASTAALGEGGWHTRTRTCNELTGCAAWTDTRTDYISARLGLATRSGRVYPTLSDTPIAERSINCNSSTVDNATVTCNASDSNYRTHSYQGKVTDHCAQLKRTIKTNPNSTNSWTETEQVFTQRFPASQERTFSGPTVPSRDAASGSPFAAATCADAPITQTEALSRFAAGASSAQFAAGEWHRRDRTCNELTGCTEWDESQGFLSAATSLNIRNSKVYLGLTDTPIAERSINCNSTSVDQSQVTCNASDSNYRTHSYTGRVTDSCTRLERVITNNPNSTNSYTQTQYVYFQNN